MLCRRKARDIMKAQERVDKLHAMHRVHCIIPRRRNKKIQQQATNYVHTQNFAQLPHENQIKENNRARENYANRALRHRRQRHADIHEPIALMDKRQQRTCHKEKQRRVRHRRLAHVKELHTACQHHRRPEACTLTEESCRTNVNHHGGRTRHQRSRQTRSELARAENSLRYSHQPIIHRRLIIPVIAKNAWREKIACLQHFLRCLRINRLIRVEQRYAADTEKNYK